MTRSAALLGLLLAAAFAAYLPAVDGTFLLDDYDVIQDPLVVDPPADLARWLDTPRPLATLTFAANHAAVGLDPRGWHLTSMAIHLAVVLLAFAVARLTLARAGLARPGLPALAAAALFALHPLQTESVAYLTQRTEALAAGLVLLGLWLLLRRDAEARPARRHALLAAAVAVQALGLLAKPTAAVLPAAWLLHAALVPPPGEEAVPGWRRAARRLPAALPLLALGAASVARILAAARGALHVGFEVPGLSPAAYLATQLRVIPTYLRLAAWPAGQCGDWHFPPSGGFLEPAVIGGGLLLAALAGGALLLAARARGRTGDGPAAARAAALGVLLFLVSLAPSSSVVPLLDPLAEHRVYLGLLWLALAVAAGAAAALRRLAPARAPLAGAALAIAAAAVLGALTARRAAVWTDSLAFWSDAAAKAPGKARVHLNLGQALADRQRTGDALAAFRRARDLRADHTVEGPLVLKNIVSALATLGRVDEAREELRAALEADPGDAGALALLAQVELVGRRPGASEEAALRAIAADPKNGLAHKILGLVRADRGDLAGAGEAFRRAAATNLADPNLYFRLGEVEERLGALPAACAAYERGATTPGNGWISQRAAEAFRRLGCP